MREIKFRAWHRDKQVMFKVYETEMESWYFWAASEDHQESCLCGVDGTEVDVMQYTGLKDANGVEIYEGDIVEVFGTASQVMYSKSNASFRYQHIAAPHSIEALGNYSAPAFKVIGNIHEHPELLNTH